LRSKELLHSVTKERNILHTVIRRKAKWTGHILRRNCFLKHINERKVEGRIEVTGRRGRRRKQLLDDLKEMREFWKLEEEKLNRSLWRTGFGRDSGTTVGRNGANEFFTSLNKITVENRL